MFSDEKTFTIIRGVPKMVRRPSSASRYDPKCRVKTMKDPGSVMVWGGFQRKSGPGWFVLPYKKM